MTTASRVRLRLVGDERLVASVRVGDAAAFEALYDRHAAELLSFCVYMLGSRHDAEDAVQATFASAYRTLCSDRRTVTLRPWLFAIARNNCLSILRRRRPWVELNGEPALDGDPLRKLELREEVRQMIEGLRALPEAQRASLVLAELHGFSQAEIGSVLGVQAEQVKAFICQARSNLISERTARDADCREIREELATARGPALLRGRLRRHLRACEDCRTYADGVARQRRHLGVLLPIAPTLVLKYRALEGILGGIADPGYVGGTAIGGTMAGAAADLAGGGMKALALKIAAGVACLGTGAGAAGSVLIVPSTPASATQISASATLRGRGSRAPSVASEAALRAGRTRRSAGSLGSAGAGGATVRVGTGTFGPGAGGGGPASGASVPGEAERNLRREERERAADAQQREAEAENRRAREQRPAGPAAESRAEHQRIRAERRAAIVPRTQKTELERRQAHEERIASRPPRPPKRTREPRVHEKDPGPEGSPPPKKEPGGERAHNQHKHKKKP